MSWRLLATLALGCAACGPDGGPDPDPGTPDAAVDAAVAVIDGPPAQCYDEPVDVDVAAQGTVVQACAIWNSIGQLAGHATVTRTGMTLVIDFENGVVFSGSIINNMVNLVYAHQHPFEDGCRWMATETLMGTLDPATCNFSLSYNYVESVVMGSACATPCSAQANVTLQLTPIP